MAKANLGGMAEIVHHGDNGLLFKPGSASSLASLIEAIAQDPASLKSLAENAKTPKSIAAYTAELEEIYDEVIKERNL